MNTEFSLTPDQIQQARESLAELIAEAYDNSTEHGFTKIYDDLMDAVPVELQRDMRRTTLLAKLALITSEVGEAVSALQHGDDLGFAEEVADVVIRVLDLCGYAHINLGCIMSSKMQVNRKRPYLHGKEC